MLILACLLCNNSVGTTPRKCDPVDGSCSCKPNVRGQLCNTCKVRRDVRHSFFSRFTRKISLSLYFTLQPGFYNFDASNPDLCSACGCSLFTALSSNCNLTTGQCECRSGLTSRICNETASGRYLPYLEGIVYEAEDAYLDVKYPFFEKIRIKFEFDCFALLFRARLL